MYWDVVNNLKAKQIDKIKDNIVINDDFYVMIEQY